MRGRTGRDLLPTILMASDLIPPSKSPTQSCPPTTTIGSDPPAGDALQPPKGARRWWCSRLYRDVVIMLVLNRIILFAVAWLGYHFVASGSYLPGPKVAGALPALFARFDGIWYLSIVREGYRCAPSEATNIVFFPLYPLLVRSLAATGMDDTTAGFVLSNLLLLVAVLLFTRLMARELGDDLARPSVLFLLLFPTSFYFSAVYTESLFLAVTLAAFLAARSRRWWFAGAAGGLAAATRLPGVALLVPLAFEYMQQRSFRWRRVRLDALALAVVPAGLGAFVAYCAWKFGDPLAFLHNQAVWHGRPTHAVPGYGLLVGVVKAILRPDPTIHPFPLNLLYVGIAALALGCLLASFFVLRPAYGLWGLTVLSISASHGRIDSLPRYVLVLFPVFAVLAVLGRRRGAYWAMVVVSTSLLAVLTVMFVDGYKMF